MDSCQINNKEQPIDYSNSIKKSNELSMAKLNHGLTLNQMQLLAYAIYSTQQDGRTSFRKYEFQDKFELQNYKTEDAYEDGQKLSLLQFTTKNLKKDKFSFTNVFGSITYETGLFSFKWNEDMVPHILELKEKYVLTDLTITSHFKSGFSWILYDYLKAHYGYWHKDLSKEEILSLFAVEDRKTYRKSTAEFKRGVLDVAIDEINRYTELDVRYTQTKTGNKIVGFTLHWSAGKRVAGATEKQVALLKAIHDEVERKMFDYIALEDTESLASARKNIMKIKQIGQQVTEQLTADEAKSLIWEAKLLYKQLQNLLERAGQERDTSFYYNWLEEE